MLNTTSLAAIRKYGYDEEHLTKLIDFNSLEEQQEILNQKIKATYNNPDIEKYAPIFSYAQKGEFSDDK